MSEDSGSSRPGWKRRIIEAAARAAVLLFCLGLLIRVTVRDRMLVANTIYYATPWPVLCVLGIVAAVWMKRRLRRRLSTGLGLAALGCAAMWGWTGWSFRTLPQGADGVRVVTWNLSHGNWGLEGLAVAAARLNPDLAVFVEADPRRQDVRAIMKRAFPEHHVLLLGGGLVLVSRWPGGEARAYQLGTADVETRIREVDLATPWGTWTVFACDVASDIFYQRETHLRELASRIAACADPVIVAGDFNTPLDSVHLGHLRRLELKEAFETAGSGYQPTWPIPVPVLTLDQVWVSRRLNPIHCERMWHWRSDHAAVIATIRPE